MTRTATPTCDGKSPDDHVHGDLRQGRIPGWIAHRREQYGEAGGQIARPRQVYIGPTETAYVPIERR